jgi:signal transduction histidine kinase/CheY-like chemotaxis protein
MRLNSTYSRRQTIKRTLAIFLPNFIFVFLAIAAVGWVEAQNERADLRRNENSNVLMGQQAIMNTLTPVVDDLRYLSKEVADSGVLAMKNVDSEGIKAALKTNFINFSSAHGYYDQIRVIDTSGMEIVRVNYNNGRPEGVLGSGLQNKSHRYYFKQTINLPRGQIYVSPLDLNIEHGALELPIKPMIRLAKPITDGQTKKVIGMVIINYTARLMLDRFTRVATGKDSHLMLLNAAGYWLKGVDKSDEWGFMYAKGKQLTFGRRFPMVWHKIVTSKNGQVATAQGMFTFRTVYPLPGAPVRRATRTSGIAAGASKADPPAYHWIIVSQVPAKKLSRMTALLLLKAILTAIVIFSIMTFLAFRYAIVDMNRRRSETELLESKESLERTVLERTSALQASNEALRAQIDERKKMEIEREKLQGQLLQAQKLESVGRLAGGVAHDFNNMLSVITGYAELGMGRLDPQDPLYADLQEILTAANRSANITRQLLAFARQQAIAPEVLDLNEAVESVLKMLRRLIGEDIELSWRPGWSLWPVKMDRTQIDQILANLCVNARDAIADVGVISIETSRRTLDKAYCEAHSDFDPGDFVVLAVSDNGVGMDKDTLNNIFEPFFTTKDLGQGTGLGLSTVYGIVKQNGGFINVYSEPGKGTTFRIYLRRCADSVVEDENEIADEVAGATGETVLVVEDEPSLLKLTDAMLKGIGYRVLLAKNPLEALQLAEAQNDGIDLLLTDVIMPEMNGAELAVRLQAIFPRLKCLFMSGYTADVIAHHGILEKDVHFIQKPYAMAELAFKVRETINRG